MKRDRHDKHGIFSHGFRALAHEFVRENFLAYPVLSDLLFL